MTTNATHVLILVISLAAVIAVIAWAHVQRKRKQSARLHQRFGSEYGRAIDAYGDRDRAEAELEAREKRVRRLNIVALAPGDAAKFKQAWMNLQGRFVDNPRAAVVQADQLIYDLMARRGYPMGDFERRAADISVDHAPVVEHYRAARDIAARDEQGQADTEELRHAVVHYRALFNELLEVQQAERAAPQRASVSS